MSKATAQRDVDVADIAATSEISRLLSQYTTPWYKKKNLRTLYLVLVPPALGVEVTTGNNLALSEAGLTLLPFPVL
jgi:hypothetical protein